MKTKIFYYLISRLASRYGTNAQAYNTVNSNSTILLRAESILIEEFNRANIAAYKSSDDISNNFNLYLILFGIIVSGVITLQVFVLQNAPNQAMGGVLFVLDMISLILFLLEGTISFLFLKRFIVSSYEVSESIYIMDKIKEIYIEKFKKDLPFIEDILLKKGNAEHFEGVPSHIRYIVSMLGSAGFAGAFYLIFDDYLAIKHGITVFGYNAI